MRGGQVDHIQVRVVEPSDRSRAPPGPARGRPRRRARRRTPPPARLSASRRRWVPRSARGSGPASPCRRSPPARPHPIARSCPDHGPSASRRHVASVSGCSSLP